MREKGRSQLPAHLVALARRHGFNLRAGGEEFRGDFLRFGGICSPGGNLLAFDSDALGGTKSDVEGPLKKAGEPVEGVARERDGAEDEDIGFGGRSGGRSQAQEDGFHSRLSSIRRENRG